jgi:hypothetical protein
VHRLFTESVLQVSKPLNCNQFWIGDPARLPIVARALQTSAAPFIVQFAGQRIEVYELEYGFHTSILLISPAGLLFQPLIHI